MKILVVDDEKMIRAGIVQILSSAFASEEFFEAQNGGAALSIYREQKPDILVTDIKMPIMDGLELMRAIRKEDSKISIVVVTGFDDFSYAKTALECGATAYILKPIEKEELIETIAQLIKEKRLTAKEKIERMLGRIYADGEVSRGFESLLQLTPYRAIAILNPVEEANEKLYFISPVNHGYLALEKAGDEAVISKHKNTVIAKSTVKRSFSDLREAALEALVALFERFIEPNEQVYLSKGLGAISNDIPEKVNKIVNQIGYVKSEGSKIEDSVNSLFSDSGDIDMAFYLFSVSEALKNGILSKYSYDNNEILPNLISLSCYFNLEDWKRDLILFLEYANDKKKSERPDNSFVKKAMDFVEKNYANNINMAVVSNEVGISYTYFSEKFKEYAGINFNDYLTNVRVAKAKELLEKGYYRIYEVSEKCGFSGPRYFIKIFKQVTGITPTTYMNSHMKG